MKVVELDHLLMLKYLREDSYLNFIPYSLLCIYVFFCVVLCSYTYIPNLIWNLVWYLSNPLFPKISLNDIDKLLRLICKTGDLTKIMTNDILSSYPCLYMFVYNYNILLCIKCKCFVLVPWLNNVNFCFDSFRHIHNICTLVNRCVSYIHICIGS
jgi:hypothetical protein